MQLIVSILEQTFIYGIMGRGVYISYRILNFPDLSVDGSFPFGAAVSAVLILKGVNPFLSLLIAMALGSLIGLVTGIIHVKFGIPDLLSGILVMLALYSVNLRIVGTSNVALFGEATIFNTPPASFLPEALKSVSSLLVVFVLFFAVKLLMDAYLKTKSGFLLRAVGDNPRIAVSLAKNPGKIKIMGLMLSNALVSLSGAVLCQYQRSFEITMGSGKMVMGLAGVIIGMSIFSRLPKVKGTTTVLGGMFVYEVAVMLAILVGLNSNDLKLVTSVIFFVALVANRKGGLFRKGKKNAGI